MSNNQVVLWGQGELSVVPNDLSDPVKLVEHALQLRDRERLQLVQSFSNESYEVASSFVWMRSMALLRKQLASLGIEFIGELLQKPDVSDGNDITDFEAISIARDLGMINGTQALRLFQARDTVAHFASGSYDQQEDDESMTKEEAIGCLRVCVQSVLAQQSVPATENFKRFRDRLAGETFLADSDEVSKFEHAPYLFVRTAVGVLLSLLKSRKGAELEHASRNAMIIIPKVWNRLKGPERWQIGQTYASEYNEGRKETVRSLHAVLLAVKGFDYVPESLRSNTFIKAAQAVIAAHENMNNFYNEAAPMNELANLGTSIPGPAVAWCITAVLCVKIGNPYGVARNAQFSADIVFKSFSDERWLYYLNEEIEQDRRILSKLTSDSMIQRWISFMKPLNIDRQLLRNKIVRDLLPSKTLPSAAKIASTATILLRASIS